MNQTQNNQELVNTALQARAEAAPDVPKVSNPASQQRINEAASAGALTGAATGASKPSYASAQYARAAYMTGRNPQDLGTYKKVNIGPVARSIGPKKGFLSGVTLEGPNKALRAVSMGSPLVRAALVGGAGYLGTRLASPYLMKYTAPMLLGQNAEDLSEEERQELTKWLSIAGGAVGLGLPLASDIDPGQPWWGLKKFKPMIRKTESFDFNNEMDAIPLGYAKESILANPRISPMTKSTSLMMLNAFDAPASTPITFDDVVQGAVETGMSALKGGAVGFLTAKVLGLSKPMTAVGIGAATSAAFNILRR